MISNKRWMGIFSLGMVLSCGSALADEAPAQPPAASQSATVEQEAAAAPTKPENPLAASAKSQPADNGASHMEDYQGHQVLVMSRSTEDQQLRDNMKFCGGLEINDERLSCYEKAALNAGLPVWKSDLDDGRKTYWGYKEDIPNNDYEVSTSLRLPGGGLKSQLFIRCHRGRMELYEKWPIPVGSRTIKVSVSPDKKNEQDYDFKPSVSGSSMGMWDSHDATTVAKYLTSLGEGPIYFNAHFADGDDLSIFHLDGIQRAILGVRRSCNW